MKFFHLSDLHPGRRMYEFSLLDDQRFILKQILSMVREERPAGVLLAGDIDSSQKAVAAALSHMEIDTSCRNILVAHQFVTGAGRCESEEIPVGGLDSVEAALFDAFDYVALGRLHSPQTVAGERVR